MNVSKKIFQISIRVNMQALKRAREYRALSAIFSVEVHGVAGGKLGHELGEVAGSPFPE